jgi:hypothetical protein
MWSLMVFCSCVVAYVVFFSLFSVGASFHARGPRYWTRVLSGAVLLLWAVGAQADDVYINKKFPIRGGNGPTLSPPYVEPTNECAAHVYVDSFVPHATVKVFLNGSTLIGGPIAPEFGFAAINLSHPLHTGDKVTATQTVNGVTSAPSTPMVVGSMPSSLPAPTVDPKIYACGRVVPVHGLVSGVAVEVQDETAVTTIGNGFTPNDWGSDWDPVGTSALTFNHEIKAKQSACTGIQSGFSPSVPEQPEPSPLTAPTLDPPIVNNDAITAHGLFTGALVEAFDTLSAPPLGSGYATAESNWMHIAPPVKPLPHEIWAQQTLCHRSPKSKPTPPTETIPEPLLLGPICPRQSAAFVRNSTINATLVLLKNGMVVGYGGAAPGDVPIDIAPPASFGQADTVQVAEYIHTSVVFSNQVIVGCTDVVTYHNDAQRTGWNSKENTLTTTNVNPKSFGHIVTVPLDDQVDTQPLVVSNQTIEGAGTQSVVYVTTESNTLYAINTWTGDILKQRTLGTPVPTPLGCGNNGPNVGINGTHTIDLASHTLYIITYTLTGGVPTHQLHALDLGTLSDLPGSPVTVSATQSLKDGSSFQFNAIYQRQRAALLAANGGIYAGFASYCDFKAASSRGWLLGWDKSSLAPLSAKDLTNRLPASTATVDCTYVGNHPCFLSSIWMSGYGVAADPTGNLYFTTGNSASGTYDGTFNVAESAVKMSGDLSHVLDLFTPSNVNTLDTNDEDYGSGGLMVLPDQPGQFPHLAVAAGKDGRMFVLNQDSMGGFHPTDIPSNVQVGACWCGPSYFNTGAAARLVSSGGDGGAGGSRQVKLWALVNLPPVPSLSAVASAPATESSGQDGGFFTSISSNGTTPNTAIIWAVDRPAGNDHHVTLYAYNATPSGGTLPQLWSGIAGAWENTGGNSNIVPTVANGRVYVASNKQLQIFGLIAVGGHTRAFGELAEAKVQKAAVEVLPVTGAQFWGTVKSIEGTRMALELRNGRLLQVDFSPAIKEGRAAIAGIGQPVLIKGKIRTDGIFEANMVMRAKGRSLWGEDREQ